MYYIYHIPGVKIGCTSNLERRIKQQTKGQWELLETHTNIDIASQREQELQKRYGYKVDKSTYKESIEKNPGKQSLAGKISASNQWKKNRDRELLKCKKGGLVTKKMFSKKTIMCDMNGTPLKTFSNRKEAAKFVNGNAAPLTAVLDNPNRSYKGYRWKNG